MILNSLFKTFLNYVNLQLFGFGKHLGCTFAEQKRKMTKIIVKTEKGEFKYTKWQWNLAWFLTWLGGVIVGITCF